MMKRILVGLTLGLILGSFTWGVNSALRHMTAPLTPSYSDVKDRIKRHEGLRLKPYVCSEGYMTIGYGRNLSSRGISPETAELILEQDFKEALADLETRVLKDDWSALPYAVRAALINMRYQLGPTGLRSFTSMLDAVRDHDWITMVDEMRDSLWYRQTTDRAESLIQDIAKGVKSGSNR